MFFRCKEVVKVYKVQVKNFAKKQVKELFHLLDVHGSSSKEIRDGCLEGTPPIWSHGVTFRGGAWQWTIPYTITIEIHSHWHLAFRLLWCSLHQHNPGIFLVHFSLHRSSARCLYKLYAYHIIVAHLIGIRLNGLLAHKHHNHHIKIK